MEQSRQCLRRLLVLLWPKESRPLPRRLFSVPHPGSSFSRLAARSWCGAPTPTAGGQQKVVVLAGIVFVRHARPVDRSLVTSGAGASTASHQVIGLLAAARLLAVSIAGQLVIALTSAGADHLLRSRSLPSSLGEFGGL